MARPGRRPARALALVLTMALGACSWYPDWANPKEWYDSAVGDNVPPPPQQADAGPASVPGAQEPFPSLSTVPERPQAPTSPEQQQALAQGLVGDRDQARYTSEALRGTPAAAPPAVTPAPILAPAPPPAPTLAPAPPPAPSLVPAPPAVTAAASALPQPRIVAQAAPPPVISSPPPAPYPQLSPAPSAPLPSVAQPAVQQTLPWLRTAPSLTPMPAPTPAYAQVPRAALPFGFQPAVATDQGTLAQTFAASLAASAATVVTTPVHGVFDASTSQPLARGSVPVAEVVRQNYNEALSGRTALIASPGAINGYAIQVASVKFSNGSAALSGTARRSIKGAAQQHKSRGGRVVIIGHASERTKDLPIATHNLLNFKLSADRAQAVAKQLMRNGVQASAVVIEARGANDPLYYEWMPQGEAQNRRADIYLQF